MPPGRKGRAKAARVDSAAAASLTANGANGMPAAVGPQPSPAPLPGGFKSMKNRWLAEFEAEQAAKQAAEQAANAAQQAAAEVARAAEEAVLKAEPAEAQPEVAAQPAAQARQPDGNAALAAEKQPAAKQPAAKQRRQRNGHDIAAQLRAEEQDALAPDTSSAHSEADQHPRPPKDDQPPADERLPSPPAGAVASAVLLQLATTLKQSTVSPASDADSTKHHSPAGGAAAAAKAERCQPDAAVGKQAAGATKGGARAGAPGQRKRKSEAAAEPDQQRRKLSAPRNGDAPGNGDAKPAGQATQGPDADLPPHLRRAAAGKGGADGEAARPAAAVQEQRLSLVQQQEQQSAAAAAHPQEPQQLQPGDTKRPGKQADDQPMQDGKTPRPPPSGGRGGRRAESGKPDVKLEPPAVSGAVKRGPDADAAPSGKDGAGPDKRSGAVEKAAEAGAKASYWQQHTRETLRQQQGDAPAAQPEGGYRSQGAGSLDAELRQAGGGGAAAASPVGLHCLGSDGSSQQLGKVDLQACSCRAEVLKEIYAQHAASLPGRDSARLTYEDEEGDWMLLHDVTPWSDFVASARSLLVTT